jgi:hypothetical protein
MLHNTEIPITKTASVLITLLALLVATPLASQPSIQGTIDNSGQFTAEITVAIPEVFELANIAIAMTLFGQLHPYYVEKDTPYYDEVMQYFAAHKMHPFIKAIQQYYGDVDRFNFFKMRAVASTMDGNTVVCDKSLIYLESEDDEAQLDEVLSLAGQFASDTGFRSFYEDHLPYYREHLNRFRMATPARDCWRWLERHFPNRYARHRIFISPLTGWSHFSVGRGDRIDTYIFGPAEAVSNKVEEGMQTMVFFTEIDHHYVDPVSRIHEQTIDRVFSNVQQWNQQGGYRTPFLAFSEYMTWAVFCLYAHDRYSPEEFAEISQGTVEFMTENRHFSRFGEFNDQLVKLYRNRAEGETIPDLYPRILSWAADEQPR